MKDQGENMQSALNIKDALSALEWVNKVLEVLKPYKPIKKRMKINQMDKTSEIALVLNMPSRLKLNLTTTKIPYPNFFVNEMLTEDFSPLNVSDYWRRDHDGSWILNPKNLPNCDRFFVRLKGTMPQEVISKLVFIGEAANRDQTEESDKYWLECMIKDVELVETMWEMLEIEDVNVGINVGINRCFSAAIPSGFTRKLRATQRYIEAGHTRDRQKVYNAWAELRRSHHTKSCSPEEFMELISRLTSGTIFGNYVHVEEPYNLGLIDRGSDTGVMPNFMRVQALTNLDLKKYAAGGYLVFEKKKYIEEIKGYLGVDEK